MAVRHLRMPWVIRRNETFAPVFQVVDGNGSAVNITGYTITAEIRTARSYNGGSSIATLTVAMVDASDGTFKASLTQAATAALTAQQFAGWGQVWVTGSETDNVPALLIEAHPVSIV